MGASSILQSPFQGFEFIGLGWFASLIVPKFLNYFSTVGKKQQRVVTRHFRKPPPDQRKQLIGTLQFIGREVSIGYFYAPLQ